MRYRVYLDDNSFIIGNDNKHLFVFKGFLFPKKYCFSISELLEMPDYFKYYLMDNINGRRIKRSFRIEEDNSTLPVDARYKLAKNIELGDYVVGEDNTPRQITKLHTGISDMYELTIDGETFYVNAEHILSMVDKETGEHIDMPVDVFLQMDESFQSKMAMEKV